MAKPSQMKPKVLIPLELAFACVGVCLGLTAFTIDGATICWTNTSGGLWSSPANWSPNVVPGSSDTALIAAAGTYTVTLDTSVTISSLTLGGASGVQTLTNYSQTLAITNSSQVTANGLLALGGGTLTGGPLTLAGTLNYGFGVVWLPVSVAVGGVLNLNEGAVSINSPLTNSGTVNWSGSGVTVNNNNASYTGAIYNQPLGLFNLQSDQTLYCGCYGFETFNNAGIVRKTAGSGTNTFSLVFTNSGTVDAQSGTIRFSGGGNIGGTYNTGCGAVIEFSSANTLRTYTETDPVNVTGTGICRLNGAHAVLNNRIANFILGYGDVLLTPNFQTNGTIQNLQLDGAYLIGTNVVTGTLGFNGGGLGLNSLLTVAVGGVLNFSGASALTFGPLTVAVGGVLDFNGALADIYAPLTNLGTVNWSNGFLTLHGNAGFTGNIYNQPFAWFNIQSDQVICYDGFDYAQFYNAGTVRKTAGKGTTDFEVWFNNTGTIDAQSGVINFGPLYSDYHAQTGGVMSFGITSPTDYGQISFNPYVNHLFRGVLSIDLNGGYSPSAGDSFALVSYGSYTGAFTNLVLPPASQWQANYGTNTFTLSVLSVNPAAGAVTLPPIYSRAINPGSVLLITNTATDSNPANQISYSLTAAPAGASIGPSNGILQWIAPANTAGTSNFFTVLATDNGLPPASASRSFIVLVSPLAPVNLTALSYLTGQFSMRIDGSAGLDYIVLVSTNLSNWTGISTSTPAALPITVTDTNAGAFPRRFYRVLLGP
jgi:hypothetical protein